MLLPLVKLNSPNAPLLLLNGALTLIFPPLPAIAPDKVVVLELL